MTVIVNICIERHGFVSEQSASRTSGHSIFKVK
jgi:hypothetical protein